MEQFQTKILDITIAISKTQKKWYWFVPPIILTFFWFNNVSFFIHIYIYIYIYIYMYIYIYIYIYTYTRLAKSDKKLLKLSQVANKVICITLGTTKSLSPGGRKANASLMTSKLPYFKTLKKLPYKKSLSLSLKCPVWNRPRRS